MSDAPLATSYEEELVAGNISATAAHSIVLDQLKKLGELRDSGLLTDQEFEDKKRMLLQRL